MSTSELHNKVEELKKNLGVAVCSFYQANNDLESLKLVATAGLNQNAIGARLHFSQGLTGKVASTHKPVAARNIEMHPDNYRVKDSDEEQYKSYLGIPLIEEDTLHGVLVVQTVETKTFFQDDIRKVINSGVELLNILASSAELA